MSQVSYIESGVEWIGRLPGSWQIKPMFSVVEEVCERNAASQVQNVLSLSYGRIIRRDVTSNVGLLPDSFSTYQIVRTGDIVLRLLDLQNDHVSLRVGLVPEEGIVTSAYVSVRPRNGLVSEYAAYLLHAYDIKKVFYSFGGGCRQSMGFEDLKRLPIPFPSPLLQHRIVTYLDEQTGKIDRLMEMRRQQMALLKEQRAALIQQAVTRGLNPNAPMKDSGLPCLGEIPAHWCLTRAKFVSDIFVPQRNKPELNEDEGYYWITMEEMSRPFIDSATYRVSDTAVTLAGSRILPCGAVIASCVGNFGAASINAVPVVINQQLQAFIPHRINNEFLRLLITMSASYFEMIATAATLVYVNQVGFANFPVPLPPEDEQLDIIDFIASESIKLDAIHAAYARQLTLLAEYRAALIHECVTGQRTVSQRTVVEAAPAKANIPFLRAVLCSEIVHRLHQEPTFGRVKLEKFLYLSEAYAGIDLEGKYQRAAAGPFDNQALRSAESQIQKQKWYQPVKGEKGTRYLPMEKAGGHQKYFSRYWPEQQPKFDRLFTLLRSFDTERCEIVATLFAVWHDRLRAEQPCTDADIVDEVLTKWHPSKQRISRDRWLKALEWMRQEGLTP